MMRAALATALGVVAASALTTAVVSAATTSIAGTVVASERAVRVPVASDGSPVVGGCPVFPADNAWNTDISAAPLHPRSAAIIARLGGNLHPDFGENPEYGIPVEVVPAD